MKCPLQFDESSELVVGYGARTLDPETGAAFERHLAACPVCREAAAVQTSVWAALDHALDDCRETFVSPDFDERLFRRIARVENRGWWLRRVLVPAAACIALATVLLFNQRVGQPDSAPAPQVEQVQHALDDMDLLNQIGTAI